MGGRDGQPDGITRVRGFSKQKGLTISRTHLSLYLAAAMAVLPGPAGAPCIVAALACRIEQMLKLSSLVLT